jgi:pimeloyl-ACP methyl ester carboxylesterase
MTYAIEGAEQRNIDLGDVTLSVHVAGEPTPGRPAVIFSHGFPELAYTWRNQLPAIAAAGFLAVAPDQRGYGGSGSPEVREDFDIFHLTGDLVGLLDALEVDRAVFVGHDWGGFIVWQMPLLHPDRTAGVVGLNTPYIPRFPMKPTELFRMAGGENHYILYFQEPGVADAALAANVDPLFRKLMRRAVDPALVAGAANEGANFIESVIDAPELGDELLTPDELAVYVDTFTKTGFTGGLNWYRNFDRNWEETPQLDGARIDGVPSMMITAEWDPVLPPAMAAGMPDIIDDLEMHNIDRCGHWTQQEFPTAVSSLLVDFLDRRFT